MSMGAKTRRIRTTVEVPDDLYRRAKAEAALRGRKLKDLVEEAGESHVSRKLLAIL